MPVVDPDAVVIPHDEHPLPRAGVTADGILAWSDPDAGAWVAEWLCHKAWGVASSGTRQLTGCER